MVKKIPKAKKAPTLKEQIYVAMKDILAGCPDGMRAGELNQKIKDKLLKKSSNSPSIMEQIAKLMSEYANQEDDFVKKQWEGKKGTFYALAEIPPTLSNKTSGNKISQSAKWKEPKFYDSFAKHLTYGNDDDDDEGLYLEECTKAIVLGGKEFGQKWGTPDVIGIFKPWDNAAVQFPHEIISVEMKITLNNPIQALGQACAYRLFSHKVYLVIPESDNPSKRIEALCRIHGIGLVYFNPNVDKITSSIYKIKFYAQRHTPNLDFVNSVITENVINELYDQKKRPKS